MKALIWIIALLGLWEFADIAALFIPDFGSIQAFVWNHIVIGLILMLCGIWAALTKNHNTAKTLLRIAAAAGGWLIIAPFLLGPPAIAAGLWNDIIVGAIVLILSIWAAVSSQPAAS